MATSFYRAIIEIVYAFSILENLLNQYSFGNVGNRIAVFTKSKFRLNAFLCFLFYYPRDDSVD